MSTRAGRLCRSLFFLWPFLAVSAVSAFQPRQIKIIEVRDANLFFTEDSQLISLANVHSPSLQDSDSLKKALADKFIKFSREQLLSWPMQFIPSPGRDCGADSVISGHLYKEFPLSRQYINALYLERGMGFYLPCDTLHRGILFAATQKGIEKRLGVWQQQKEGPVNLLRRFRGSVWLYPVFSPNDKYIPVFGFNYRWSDLIKLYKKDLFYTNLTAETGTLVFFYFPYIKAGWEAGYGNLYLRLNYGAVLPLPGQESGISSRSLPGLDIGFRFQMGKAWMELEYNLNRTEVTSLNIVTLSFILPANR